MEIIKQLLDNSIFLGVSAAAFSGGLMYLLRAVPNSIWEFIKWKLSISIIVFSEDQYYDAFSSWLAKISPSKTFKNIRMKHSGDEYSNTVSATPGMGYHLLWYHRRPLIVYKHFENNSSMPGWGESKRIETLNISILFGNQKIVRALIVDINKELLDVEDGKIGIKYFCNHGYWKNFPAKNKRNFDTIFVLDEIKSKLINRIDFFLKNEKWYVDRGIPYRCGILLFGPPGCGKSSIATALAGKFDLRVHALNVGSLKDDEALISAVNDVGRSILLIEDIDAINVAAKRETDSADKNKPDNKDASKGITLSALLNVLDGAFAADGRIVIATTNHPEKIDPALIRPGRMDLHIKIDLIERDASEKMCKLICGENIPELFDNIAFPIAPAELQAKLIEHLDKINAMVRL